MLINFFYFKHLAIIFYRPSSYAVNINLTTKILEQLVIYCTYSAADPKPHNIAGCESGSATKASDPDPINKFQSQKFLFEKSQN